MEVKSITILGKLGTLELNPEVGWKLYRASHASAPLVEDPSMHAGIPPQFTWCISDSMLSEPVRANLRLAQD